MLWAQHADASTSPERPERSKVICLRVIVFDRWQLCAHIYACISKLQALLPFTPYYQLQEPWVVSVMADKNTKRCNHSNWSSCHTLSRSPSSKGFGVSTGNHSSPLKYQRQVEHRCWWTLAFSEHLTSKDWFWSELKKLTLEWNWNKRHGCSEMIKWLRAISLELNLFSQQPCIQSPTQLFFSPVSCFSLKTILVSACPTILFGEQGIVDKVYNNYGKSHLLIDGWSTSQSHHILATVNWHHWISPRWKGVRGAVARVIVSI